MDLHEISSVGFLGTSWKQLNMLSCVYVLPLHFPVFINLRVVLGKDLLPWVRKPFPSSHWKSSHVPMLILTKSDCLFCYDCLYLFCFAGCKGRGEFFCLVKPGLSICKSAFKWKACNDAAAPAVCTGSEYRQKLQGTGWEWNCRVLLNYSGKGSSYHTTN